MPKKAIAFLDPSFQPSKCLPKGNRQADYPVPALPPTRQERAIIVLGRRVLVVEDDSVQRRQIARALREAGCDVSEASEGLEAICLLDDREIHLVLTDIRMPCLDGISLLKYLKTFFRHIPVVVITGYPEDTEDFEPDALLCKPFAKAELIALIRHLTRGPSPWVFIQC
ncbi:MAG: response regulator [Candidatus Abyssobacteria bacterium SURF_17]|uniref:Response regulator n=1 Tax=Candidatus Abyssobacteria bacterium SURF_17 TaxID=2093361 RepID=A0A419ENM4_9BACT|nr:MAG: response regulator [Candidatus Abyssubacteria bacterium SURF_17]